MSMDTTALLKDSISKRNAEAVEFKAATEKAATLNNELTSLREDLARVQKRRDQFAAIGAGHVEKALESYEERYRSEIVWEPLRSKLTGAELAAGVDREIDTLQGEISKREKEITRLLGQA